MGFPERPDVAQNRARPRDRQELVEDEIHERRRADRHRQRDAPWLISFRPHEGDDEEEAEDDQND